VLTGPADLLSEQMCWTQSYVLIAPLALRRLLNVSAAVTVVTTLPLSAFNDKTVTGAIKVTFSVVFLVTDRFIGCHNVQYPDV
jgi:hypothetical protein